MNDDIIPECVEKLILKREMHHSKISLNLEKMWLLYDTYMPILYRLSNNEHMKHFDCFIVNTIKNNLNQSPEYIHSILTNKLKDIKLKHSIIQYRKTYRTHIGLGY